MQIKSIHSKINLYIALYNSIFFIEIKATNKNENIVLE